MVTLGADVRLNLKQEWGNHSGEPSDSDCLDRPADKGYYRADWRQLSESESESESACTMRVPLLVITYNQFGLQLLEW